MIELHFVSLAVGFAAGLVTVLAIVGATFIEQYTNKKG